MAQIDNIIAELSDVSRNLIVRLTANITAELREETPVDTGWARANWFPQVGQPRTTTVGTSEEANAGNVDSSAAATSLSNIFSNYEFPDTVFISNNVPYILPLNEGSSRQAPRMFVQMAIARAVRLTTGG